MKLYDKETLDLAHAVQAVLEDKTLVKEAKYPHDMFHPKTGEKVVANNEEEHNALSKKGYTHEAPKENVAGPADLDNKENQKKVKAAHPIDVKDLLPEEVTITLLAEAVKPNDKIMVKGKNRDGEMANFFAFGGSYEKDKAFQKAIKKLLSDHGKKKFKVYVDGNTDLVDTNSSKTIVRFNDKMTVSDVAKAVDTFINKQYPPKKAAPAIDQQTDTRTIVTASDEKAAELKKKYHGKGTKVRIMKRKSGNKVYFDSKTPEIHKAVNDGLANELIEKVINAHEEALEMNESLEEKKLIIYKNAKLKDVTSKLVKGTLSFKSPARVIFVDKKGEEVPVSIDEETNEGILDKKPIIPKAPKKKKGLVLYKPMKHKALISKLAKGQLSIMVPQPGIMFVNKKGEELPLVISEETVAEAKLKAGKGKSTVDVDHNELVLPSTFKKFKLQYKKTSDGYDVSGEKKNIIAYLQSSDYGMDSDDIEEFYPELIEQSDKQKKYKAFFDKALKKFGVDSPAELEGDKKKEFFNYVDANYEAENEED